MRTYELLYIISATLTDEEVGKIESEIQSLLQKYGAIPKESRKLGKFKLTYLIKKVRHGHYVLVNFEADPLAIAKINEALRIHESVTRHLILLAEEAGGSEFNLVQFQEVVVEGSSKDDRAKRKRALEKGKLSDDAKAAAELEKKDEEPVKPEAVVKSEPELISLSTDELDRKIDAALKEDTN
ncbi:MAG: 30S ribosomal protein S6 [Patescibacteria group bacterium]|jgi:small subunit ribosomal protein S6